MISVPDMQVVGDVYRLWWNEELVGIDVARVSEHRDGLHAEITIRSERVEKSGLIHQARFNLASTQARSTLAKTLSGRMAEVDWAGMLEQLCFKVTERYRKGEPLIDLREVSLTNRPRWLLEPFLEYGGPTVLFADGGAGKSMFALGIAVSVASGFPIVTDNGPQKVSRVWYMDWEASPEDHRERIGAIAKGYCIEIPDLEPIYYTREAGSLMERAPEARTKIAELGVGLVVIDSAAAARGGEPESADTTIKLFNACRLLECPVLIVDHVVKNADKPSDKPFGSVYTHNMSRLMWRLTRGEDDEETGIALTNTKSNNGRLHPKRGYRMHYETEDGRLELVGWQREEMSNLPGLRGEMSRRDAIREVLVANGRAMTVPDIRACLEADGVKVSNDTVHMTLKRSAGSLFQRVGFGRNTSWGLAAHG